MKMMRKRIVLLMAYLSVVLFLSGCIAGKSSDGSSDAAGGSSTPGVTTESGMEKIELASLEEMTTGAPLQASFTNIVIGKFITSQQIKTDYPKAAQDCENKIIAQLQGKKVYKHVTTDSGKKLSGKTALIDLEIVDMRITSSTARMWGGVFAGKSFMDVKVTVRSAGAQDVLHQKLLSSSNNAWAASYSGGSSDRNLPADFGVLIGEYFSKIIPAK